MPGLIEGYDNDIFISYCQKDNKLYGWVTEFVELLKGELECTVEQASRDQFGIKFTYLAVKWQTASCLFVSTTWIMKASNYVSLS